MDYVSGKWLLREEEELAVPRKRLRVSESMGKWVSEPELSLPLLTVRLSFKFDVGCADVTGLLFD